MYNVNIRARISYMCHKFIIVTNQSFILQNILYIHNLYDNCSKSKPTDSLTHKKSQRENDNVDKKRRV